ncbi:TolC family protein [Croceimicrobium sp.]|uniref:TolC family protein n=1 Tax=Croceimicrobium sp. TaxID=2828340 RepID=UPI003BA94921
MLRKLFLLLGFLCLFAHNNLQAQTFGRTEKTVNEDSLIIDLADYLPPLNLLIDSAVANAPQIEYYRQRQLMFEYEIGIGRNQWMEGVRVYTNYNLGTSGASDGNIFIQGFQYGINAQIPLSMFFGQRDAGKMSKAASMAEEAQKKRTIIEIETEVEETFSRLFMLRDLIKEATNAKESAQFIYEQSEAKYIRGEISLDELGQNADLRTKWATNYITLKTQFYDTYRRLERLVGVPFSKFNDN